MIEDIKFLQSYERDHSEAAFAELVRRHIDFVYNTALRRLNGDEHLAHDVTQTVFTDLSRKAATLSHRSTLSGWLYTSTRYAAANVVRVEQRRRRREQEAMTMHDQLNFSDTPCWENLRPVIDDALDQLREGEREAVLLRFFEGRNFTAVGEALAVSEDAARMRVERALDKLRAVLARRGVTSTSVALATVLAAQPVIAAPAGLAAAVTKMVITSGVGVATTTWGFLQTLTATKTVLAASALATIATIAVVGTVGSRRVDPLPVAAPAPTAVAALEPAPSVQKPLVVAQSGPSQPVPQYQPSLPGSPDPKPTTPEVRDSAEYRQKLAVMARARLDTTYGPLFKRLGLTGFASDQFKDLLIEKQQVKMDVIDSVLALDNNRRPPQQEFIKMVADNQRDVDNRIMSLLGGGYQEYLKYEFNYPRRVTVNLLQASLHGSDQLTPAQIEQLIEAMGKVAHFPPPEGTTGRNLEAGAGLATETFNLITSDELLVAQPLLTPVQWEAMRALQMELHRKRR